MANTRRGEGKMTNKSNVEIIEEAYKNSIRGGVSGNPKQFATTLLSKLNRLDRKNVYDLVFKYHNDGRALVDQILTLIPEEGIKIAEGEFIKPIHSIDIYMFGDNRLNEIMENFAEKHNSKKGRLIFIESKE